MRKPVCKILSQEPGQSKTDFNKKVNTFLEQFCSDGNLIGPVSISHNEYSWMSAAITFYALDEKDIPVSELAKMQILPNGHEQFD